MTREELIEKAKNVIAVGCGCDRWCNGVGQDYCGCREDAELIVSMVLNAAADQLDKPWPGPDSAANIVRNLP